MKKLTYLLFLAIGVTACSVESMDSTENLLTADAKMLVSSFSLTAPAEVCAGLPATFSYAAPVNSNLQVQKLVGADWVPVYQNNKSSNATETFTLTFAEAGVYSLRYKDERGFSDPMTVTVTNCSTCTESFSYTSNVNGSYTFTYVPSEDMENAEVVFTFAQGVAVSGLEGWSTNGQTAQKTMDFTGCNVYSWTVTLTPNCSGNSGNSNVWTDFKVDDVSKKGNLANITKGC